MLTLSEAAVVQHLDPAELLGELEASFGALARGEVQCPPRPEVTVPGRGFSLTMSAWQPGMQICVKIVNVFDGNLARGLPNHLAIINLFDPDTGAVTCVMDATYITGIRTAAAAVLSHKLLSRPESRIATIVRRRCSGARASAAPAARPRLRRDSDLLAGVRTCRAPRSPASKGACGSRCARRRSNARMSLCLATDAAAPVIEADWVQDECIVVPLGYHPPDGRASAHARARSPPLCRDAGRVRTHRRSDVPS